jgi:hypothetical protein
MKKHYRAIVALVGFSLGWGWMNHANAQVSDGPEGGTYAGIPYLSGGIGLDERETLRSVGKEYNLHLSFALTEGNYLSDVEVLITDAKGRTAVEAISHGPWFFAELPAGTYRIRAERHGQWLEQVVQVTQHTQTRRVFLWNG